MRFRIPKRLSLRCALGLIAVFAVYFALRRATKDQGYAAVSALILEETGRPTSPSYVAPLLFEHWVINTNGPNAEVEMKYYFWFPGFAGKLPFERTATDTFSPTRSTEDILGDCLLSGRPTFVNP